MAIEEEVGAAFVVEDRATSQLRRIGEAFEAVDEGIRAAAKAAEAFSEIRFGNASRSIRGLADSVATLVDATGALPAAFESAMGRVVEETARARGAIREMMVEMREMNNLGSQFRMGGGGGIFGGGPGGGGGGGGGGGRGGHGGGITAHSLYRHGGMSAFMFSPGGLAAGASSYEMLKLGGEYSRDVTGTMLAAGINHPNDPANAGIRQQVETMFNTATPGTIYDRAQVAHQGPSFMNIAGSGFKNADGSDVSAEERVQKAAGVFRPLMQFAESQQQQGLGSLEDNVKAGVKYMHLLRDYDPEKLEKDLDELAAISRSTGTSARAVEAIEKYSVTIGSLAGADPHEIAKLTGYLGQAGVTGSTAGTGLSRIMLEALKPDAKTGTPTALGDHLRKDMERALRGEGPSDHHNAKGSGESAKAREHRERVEMGLIGADGKPTYVDSSGNIDVMKEIKIVSDYSAKMDELGKHAEAATKILDVFKIQASRALEPFLGKENQANLSAYFKFVDDTAKNRGSVAVQTEYAKEPIQQFEQAWKRSLDALISISDRPLHDLGTAAEGAARSLEKIAAFFDKNKDAASIVGDAVVGATGGAAAGAILGPYGIVAGAVLGGTAGAIIGGRNRAGIGGDTNPMDYKGDDGGVLPHFDLTPPSRPPSSPPSPGGGDRWGVKPMSYDPGSATVYIEKIEFHGMSADPEEHAHQLSAALVKILSRGQMHDLGTGGGFTNSSFTTGRGISV